MPFFSVVIPLYNKDKYIERTINSVLEQTYTNFEIVIIDDGSTDKSFQKASRFKDSRITIYQQKNTGVSLSRISGINKSKGHYIALLDADDEWLPNHLSVLKKTITSLPQAILYSTNYQVQRSKSFITPAVFNFKYDVEPIIIEDYFRATTINYIPHSSASAFKRNDYYKIDGYRPELRTGQDIDLWVQFALIGKVAFNPKITMTYRFYDDTGLSNSNLNEDRLMFVNSYKQEEKTNESLKFYMDINRFALAIRFQILGNNQLVVSRLREDIDMKNLNFKQRMLLNTPAPILIFLKKSQNYLIKKNVYLTAYK